ncbi:MAG: hypothetical protein OEO79_19115, partial [Gemmatimonadota bacterium]|nr:hypothetical protein [Gemmatimonadota bacterium]
DIIRGSTDTEHLFAVFVGELARLGTQSAPDGAAGARALAIALSRALAKVTALVREHGGGEPSFLNVAVSDGVRGAVTRFTDHPTAGPESLYMHLDELYEPAGRQFFPSREGDEGPSVLVSSERLTDDERWRAVPPNHLVMFDRWTPPVTVPLEADGSWADAGAGG